jgi:hypothetical protein
VGGFRDDFPNKKNRLERVAKNGRRVRLAWLREKIQKKDINFLQW